MSIGPSIELSLTGEDTIRNDRHVAAPILAAGGRDEHDNLQH